MARHDWSAIRHGRRSSSLTMMDYSPFVGHYYGAKRKSETKGKKKTKVLLSKKSK